MGTVIAVLDQGYEQTRRARNGLARPSTAPAYYLGHPAHLWLTVMRPRTTSRPGPA